MAIFADSALLPSGWARDVRVTLDGQRIARVEAGAAAGPGDARAGILLPAPGNLHSHTFQRAMAGLTGMRTDGRDSFWTWRETMYRFAARLTPERVEAIAAMAFMEMQEAGYAAVGEFHYPHHRPDGTPHADIAETTRRIVAAAGATGIGLTHLPVLYSYGGAGRMPLEPGQRRFGNAPDRFARLVEAAGEALHALPPDARLGIAPHSLRATAPDELHAVVAAHPGVPVHIHVAEQTREVAQIEAWLGARPVEWLLDNAPVGPDWCLVHATHMTDAETRALAASGAVAGLCPVTEADLGDGLFEGAAYLRAGGAFGVGTDSNVRIALAGELRMLEYGQRLRMRARTVMTEPGEGVGQSLYRRAARGAARALARDAGEIAASRLADLLALDAAHPSLCALSPDRLLDGFVFSAGREAVTDVWSAGRHRVRAGRHVARGHIVPAYRRALADMVADA